MIVRDLGVIEYGAAYLIQKEEFEKVMAGGEDCILICEHPHVYTLGSHGVANNLLVNDQFLEKIGATYHKTDRGGDITYHGYGQIVAYPIVNVRRLGIGLREYISRLEEAVIETIKMWGIEGGRIDSITGVWLDDARGVRKICAIGVKASHDVTMHGLALNVNTDLKYFSYINPCGFTDKGVTSLREEKQKTRGDESKNWGENENSNCHTELVSGSHKEPVGVKKEEIDFDAVKCELIKHLERLLTR